MGLETSSCTKCVGGCKTLIKYGKTKTGTQRYLCKKCGKTKVASYLYLAYCPEINYKIISLTKEGLGIRSTAKLLKISATTLLKRIVLIAKNIKPPTIVTNRSYEVDEMRTYLKRKDKLIWIVYALERESKSVVSFSTGRRTNNTLNEVLNTLKLAAPRTIYTDKLKHYKYLIDTNIHRTGQYCTNNIERMNLTLRTHLKRLNRRTICFSKSSIILNSILKIYFWG